MIDLHDILSRASIHVREAGARILHVSKTAVQEKEGGGAHREGLFVNLKETG